MLKKINLILSLLGIITAASISLNTANAKSISVIAVVDGIPISTIDFEARRNFLVKTTGIADTQETKKQIDSDVMQMLIDDAIKIAEGRQNLGIGFEAAARKRAKELVAISFSQNGRDPNDVLRRLGIAPAIAEQKFYADVLWASIIQARFAKQLANTRTEAENMLERLQKDIQKPHADLDEIVLVPKPNRNYADTKKLAEQIYQTLVQGGDFSRIAQQYSASGSSQQGGRLGSVLIEALPQQIRTIIENAPAGTLTKPADFDGTIVIYRIKSKRNGRTADPLQARIDLARLVKPLNLNQMTAEAVALERQKLAQETQAATSCSALDELHQRYDSKEKFRLGTFQLGDLAPQLRPIITPLAQGQKSDIINFAEGLVVFMVCAKSAPALNLPSLATIETSIRNQHFTTLSARYLSRLRKKAIITYPAGQP